MTNLKLTDKVMIVRSRDFGKNLAGRTIKICQNDRVNKKCCHQTWVTGKLKYTNSGPTNLKETDVA